MEVKDETGNIYGYLTVKSRGINNSNNREAHWVCECVCGNSITISGTRLRIGNTKSCGCLKKERVAKLTYKHGKANSPEHRSWSGMKTRCFNPKVGCYKDYGGRGIKICDRWLNSFENFFEDMGLRPTLQHSIDRINVNGNYEPGNCRWATKAEQAANQRRFTDPENKIKELETKLRAYETGNAQ